MPVPRAGCPELKLGWGTFLLPSLDPMQRVQDVATVTQRPPGSVLECERPVSSKAGRLLVFAPANDTRAQA